MERTDTVTKIISALLFVAMLAYLSVYLVRSVRDPIQTAMAVYTTVEDSAVASGIVVRSEELITGGETYVDCSAAEGRRVSAGSVIAVSYSSEAALERANRVRELELEIARVKSLLPGQASSSDLSVRDGAIRSAVLDLTRALASHDLSELDSCSLGLRSLVYDDQRAVVSQSELAAMEAELASLEHSSTADTSFITARAPGVFSSVLDGYEALTPAEILTYGPERLWSVIRSRPASTDGAVGKLITDYTWYFAAVVSAEDAEHLREISRATLKFGRYYDGVLTGKIEHISAEMDGECAVVFSCTQALSDTLAMRQVSAEIVYAQYAGIRVPAGAMHFETAEDGTERAYVFTLTGLQAEKKRVEIVYEAEDYYLVASTGADALREGNEIIVSGKDIYDGKVLD